MNRFFVEESGTSLVWGPVKVNVFFSQHLNGYLNDYSQHIAGYVAADHNSTP